MPHSSQSPALSNGAVLRDLLVWADKHTRERKIAKKMVDGKYDVDKNLNDAASDFSLVKQNSLWSHSQHLCNFHPQEPASNPDCNVLSETYTLHTLVY